MADLEGKAIEEKQECPDDRKEARDKNTAWCLPCASTGESHPAARYCIDCDELLCQTCVDFHMKFKSTKGHKLVSCDKEDRFKGAQLLSPFLFCPDHNDRPVEVKCDEHNALCCLTCATITHRNCHSVCEIRQVAAGCRADGSVDKLRARIDEINTCIDEIVTVNDVCRKDFEASNEEIPKALKELKSNLMKLFDRIEEAVLTEVKWLHLDETVAAGNREETWKLKRIATSDHRKMIDTIQEIGTDSQIYVTCHKVREKLNEIESSLKRQGSQIMGKHLNLDIKKKLDCIFRTEIAESLVSVDSVQKPYQLPKTIEYVERNMGDDKSSDSLPDTCDKNHDLERGAVNTVNGASDITVVLAPNTSWKRDNSYSTDSRIQDTSYKTVKLAPNTSWKSDNSYSTDSRIKDTSDKTVKLAPNTSWKSDNSYSTDSRIKDTSYKTVKLAPNTSRKSDNSYSTDSRIKDTSDKTVKLAPNTSWKSDNNNCTDNLIKDTSDKTVKEAPKTPCTSECSNRSDSRIKDTSDKPVKLAPNRACISENSTFTDSRIKDTRDKTVKIASNTSCKSENDNLTVSRIKDTSDKTVKLAPNTSWKSENDNLTVSRIKDSSDKTVKLAPNTF